MRAAILVVLLAGCDWVLSLHQFEHDAPITTGWLHVAAGQYFTCAIDAHGALYCWGYNGDRELGGPSVSELDAPALVAGATWKAVTAGNEHACGLQTDDTLWCWGSNWTGQIGDGTMTNALQPVRIGTGTWKMVDTRGNTTCAIDSTDQLYCWGDNDDGQVGANDAPTEHDSPFPITVDGPWLAVSAGQSHTCALTQAHALYCWGGNFSGQIGNNDTANVTAPVAVGDTWQQIELGENFSCGLGMDGRIRCWGDNSNNQLGDGTSTDFHTPHAVLTNDADFVAIAAGSTHACALHADHSLVCWGDSTPGPLATHVSQPTPIDGGPWTELSFGPTHGCGIDTQARLWCIGDGTSGALGNGQHGPREPVKIIANIVALDAGTSSTCAIDKTNTTLCWGANNFGQLGDGTRTRELAPHPISNPDAVIWGGITVGQRHACALMTAVPSAYCWGYHGLGNGAATNLVPAPTTLDPGFTIVAAGGDHTCAIDMFSASKLTYCWGENPNGELGVDDTAVRNIPTATAGSHLFRALAAGTDFTCALDTLNRVWCTGNNDHGQIATGTMAPYYTQFFESPDVTQYATLYAGDAHACTITGGGAGVCWGRGFYGILGNRMSVQAIRSPGSVVVGTGWARFGLGDNHSCGVHTTTGTTQCWGRNDYGQLGDGTLDDSMDAVNVTALGNTAREITSGANHVCVLNATNEVWCWGDNHDGQVGTEAGWVSTFVEVPAP